MKSIEAHLYSQITREVDIIVIEARVSQSRQPERSQMLSHSGHQRDLPQTSRALVDNFFPFHHLRYSVICRVSYLFQVGVGRIAFSSHALGLLDREDSPEYSNAVTSLNEQPPIEASSKADLLLYVWYLTMY